MQTPFKRTSFLALLGLGLLTLACQITPIPSGRVDAARETGARAEATRVYTEWTGAPLGFGSQQH